MRAGKFGLVSLLAVGLALAAMAETPKEIAELFGRADAITNPALSPDGQYLAVGCSPAARPELCVFDLSGGESIVVPPIAGMRVTRHYWINAETLILDVEAFETLQTSSGKRDYAFERALAFNIKTRKPVMLLKDNRGYVDTNDFAGLMAGDPNKVMFSIVTLEDAEPSLAVRNTGGPRLVYNLMQTDLKSGLSRSLSSKTRHVVDAIVDSKGEYIAEIGFREVSTGKHTVSVRSGEKVIFERADLAFNPLSVWGLDATGQHLIVFLDEGEPFGLHRMSLADGALTPIEIETSEDAGLVGAMIDPRSLRVVGFEFPGDRTVQHVEDKALAAQVLAVTGAMPNAAVTLQSWSDNRAQSVMQVTAPNRPPEVYVFDAAKSALSPVGNIAPHLDNRPLGVTMPVTYAARDGLEISAYLTLPPGRTKADGPFPLILLPHGGPEARDTLAFDWWQQAYAAAGYAVLQPNFRGSSGYGSEFLEAGYGEFGDKMVTDVLDGAAWAAAQGYAVLGETCAVGASYGGYSALMMALKDGNAIKCVVAVNALTNPFSFLGDTRVGGFSENYLERYLGAGRFSDAAARDAISPVRLGARLTVPTLLIAGKQDSTVPFDQSQQMKRASVGKPVELIAIEGEDHYLRSTRARYDVLSNSLDFLNKHLPVK
jgi:dipeptidyl aminopeptidase/acylaminoacyl peptidase